MRRHAHGRRIAADEPLTKCLNLLFPINRGTFGELLLLVLAVIATAIILPLSPVLGVRKRLR
ncbi:MAG: hypothetical protein AB7G08_10810 [Hyphomicrobiaceae bacterium]